MQDHIIVDVETKHLFSEVEGNREALDKLGVAVAVVYSYIDDNYEIYSEGSLPELRERLLQADKITGFNSYKFDLPVIFGKRFNDWITSQEADRIVKKSNDLLRRIWISLGLNPNEFTKKHHGYSLKVICEATLGLEKPDLGKKAPETFRAGHWDLVTSYCINDVRLTKELNNFIDKYGYVINGTETVTRVWAAPEEEV